MPQKNKESVMNRDREIQRAYQTTGGDHTFYDGMITCSTIPGKAVCRLVWNMGKAENDRYLERALSGIPANFSGRLLEVPVGTGILTMPVYAKLSSAQITCLDYSPDMMARARRRAEQSSLGHVQFRQGDVGALPFQDETFDLVLSLNGFHAFPDKEAAWRETFRVLRPGGMFCGCFYVAGEHRRTDWFIQNLYVKAGFFTPPFETKDSLQKRLGTLYEDVELETTGSMASFCCRKLS